MELDPFRCTHRVKSFVPSALCIASPVPWSLPDFPLTNRFVPSRDSPFKKRREMAFGSVFVFFFWRLFWPKKNFVFLLGCIVFFWEWSVGRLGKIAMFRYVVHFCDCSFRNLPNYSFKSHKTNKKSATCLTHFASFMYQGWVRIPSV